MVSAVRFLCYAMVDFVQECQHVISPGFPWVLVAQGIEHLPSVQEVMGLIPVKDSGVFFVPHSCLVDQFTFHILFLLTMSVHCHAKY